MRQSDKLVSIVVPVYNVERYLERCIESIINQTYRNLEIILVDDGSTDSSSEICDLYKSKDERIIVFHKKNEGLSSARNLGLRNATGDYISFIDSDDYINCIFIERLLGLCVDNDADIAQCDFLCIDEFSQRLPAIASTITIKQGKEFLKDYCCNYNCVKETVSWNKLQKKQIFDGISFPKGKQHEDEFVSYKLFAKSNKVVTTNEYLYYYMQRQDSIMGKGFSLKSLDGLEALKERINYLENIHLNKEVIATKKKLAREYLSDYNQIREYFPNENLILQTLKEEYEYYFGGNIEDENRLVLQDTIDISDEKLSQFTEKPWILYGAGNYGKQVYKRLLNDSLEGTLDLWVDNFWYIHRKGGYPVQPLDRLIMQNNKKVLVAVKNYETFIEIKNNLLAWGFDRDNIKEIGLILD